MVMSTTIVSVTKMSTIITSKMSSIWWQTKPEVRAVFKNICLFDIELASFQDIASSISWKHSLLLTMKWNYEIISANVLPPLNTYLFFWCWWFWGSLWNHHTSVTRKVLFRISSSMWLLFLHPPPPPSVKNEKEDFL